MRETIELAREAGADTLMYWDIEKLKRFESLVRADERNKQGEAFQQILSSVKASAIADEREACAKVCDEEYFAYVAADTIRARGNT
jgi:hypothetical protein